LADQQQQLSAGGTDPAFVPDLITLLQQAGHSTEALAIWDAAHLPTTSDCALAAMLRAYRGQCQPERVETLTRNSLRRFPADPLWPVMLGRVLSDAGRGDEALAILAGPAAARPPIMERLLAQGYAARRANPPFDAVRYHSDAARRDPAKRRGADGTQRLLTSL
jgi:hypothetical protein